MPRFRLLLPLVLLLSGTTGCGLFDTRDPEPPDRAGARCAPADGPDRVIDNLRTAVSERNPACYALLLHPSFSYRPARSGLGAIFETWTREREQSAFERLAATYPTADLTLAMPSGTYRSLSADSAVYDSPYTLRLAGSTSSYTARGTLQLSLVTDPASGRWTIRRWEDAGTDSTWTDLRARLSQ